MPVRIVNGEVVRDDGPVAAPRQRQGGVHQAAAPPADARPPPGAPGLGAVEVSVDALAGLEAPLGLAGQVVTIPPLPALGWHRPTGVKTILLALLVVLAALMGVRFGGIAVLALAFWIHQLQTAVPPAPAPRPVPAARR
jgi:hypothetical protein